MKIGLQPEQIPLIRSFMEAMVADAARKAAAEKVRGAVASGMLEKLATGSADFDEAEIRLLSDFIGGLELIQSIAPGMFQPEGVELLKQLGPALAAARSKLNN